MDNPPNRLVGFQKVFLEPGKSKPVTITIDPAATNHPFSVWDHCAQGFVIKLGQYSIYVGNSADNTPHRSMLAWLVEARGYLEDEIAHEQQRHRSEHDERPKLAQRVMVRSTRRPASKSAKASHNRTTKNMVPTAAVEILGGLRGHPCSR